MAEFFCLSYARLIRSLMEIYRDTPARVIFWMSAGLDCSDNGAVEIHKAMAKHRATCEICRGNTKTDRRIAPMKGPAVSRVDTRRR
jgi:hypothetical protein